MALSHYKLMWIVVMFDLPVVSKVERKAATKFRNTLLDLGFEMMQFSVYMRFCTGFSKIETLGKQVESSLPEGGRVNILFFTDKQYESIKSYIGKSKQLGVKPPDQFVLF